MKSALMSARNNRVLRRQQGFGMVELMIGLVAAMLVGLAAMGSAQYITAMQRQSLGTGSALGNVTTASAALKHELALTGLGLFKDGTPLCGSLNFSVGATALYAGAAFVPLNITTTAGSSTLDLFYSTSLMGAAPSLAASAVTTTAGTVELSSYLPAVSGQSVLIAPPAGTAMPCAVLTATTVTPATATSGMTLVFGGSGGNNQVAFATAGYPTGTTVSLLDQLQWTRFRVVGGNLVMEHPADGTSAVMARDVVAFQVQYGVTNGVSTTFQSWQDAQGTWAAATNALLPQVTAVRVGLVVRAPQKEKPAADGSCTATTVQPTILGVALALTADWQCYRYRAATIIVPLRNVELGSVA